MKYMLSSFISVCLLALAALALSNPMRGESRVDGMEEKPARHFPAPAKKYEGLSDAMHEKFLENEEYAAADARLNATWAACKEWLSPGEYREVQAEQRRWLNGIRDTEAGALLDDYPLAVAYAKVISKRANELAALISAQPRNGKYESDEGEFTVSLTPDSVLISGSSMFRDSTCDFEGHGTPKKGWITISQSDLDEFYVLFTQKGANIYYLPGASMACGINAGFAGQYNFKGQ